MKKLSMLAAGVVVLSMCACTEANEFTPSTNGNTKKITEIKVSSNASALGTRTEFDTSTSNFGEVRWVPNTDQLYFFKNDNSRDYQTFTCGDFDKNDGTYYWNKFNADAEGLDVGENYYAYYFPSRAKDAFNNSSKGENDFSYNFDQVFTWQILNDPDQILKAFMSQYDLLYSPSLVEAQKNMDPIYMDHSFAFVSVDLKVKNVKTYAEAKVDQRPFINSVELISKDSENISNFATSYKISSDGLLSFDYKYDGYISSAFDSNNNYYLHENQECSLYFIVRTKSSINHLTIALVSEGFTSVDPVEEEYYMDKALDLTFNDFVFEPGKFYHFGVSIDYGGTEESAYTSKDWDEAPISVISIPNGMKNVSVSDWYSR